MAQSQSANSVDPNASSKPAQVSEPALRVVDTPVQPIRAPAFEIMSNNNAIRWLKALFYAEYGTGKTFLTATSAALPEMRDVLLLSAEAGDLTIYDPDSRYNFDLVDVVNVPNFSIASAVHDFLKLHCSARDAAARGNQAAALNLRKLQDRMLPRVIDPDRLRLYRTCIIDSLYEIESYCMLQLLGVTSDTAIDEEVNKGGWDEIGQQRIMIHRLIRQFRNLPMNILFTCPRMSRKPDKDSREQYLPMMTGKLATEVMGFVDIVGYLVSGDAQMTEADDGEIPDVEIPRRMYIQPGQRYRAKSRFTRYKKPYFNNPTIPLIVEEVGLLTSWRLSGQSETNLPELPQLQSQPDSDSGQKPE
jgi:AAA domain